MACSVKQTRRPGRPLISRYRARKNSLPLESKENCSNTLMEFEEGVRSVWDLAPPAKPARF
jgi:hypothetical protein